MRRGSVWLALVTILVAASCAPSENQQPTCRSDSPTLLMAESVPSASLIPCVDALPQGWTWHTFEANEKSATFSLEQQDGDGSLEVQLLAACDVAGDGARVEGFPTARRYGSFSDEGAKGIWTTTFPGGCSRATVSFSSPAPQSEIERIEGAISFFPRDQLQPA
jgi:hypothetical protein